MAEKEKKNEPKPGKSWDEHKDSVGHNIAEVGDIVWFGQGGNFRDPKAAIVTAVHPNHRVSLSIVEQDRELLDTPMDSIPYFEDPKAREAIEMSDEDRHAGLWRHTPFTLLVREMAVEMGLDLGLALPNKPRIPEGALR